MSIESRPDDFTLAGHQALIANMISQGYHLRGFDDALATEPHLILRHDVDMSIRAALMLARAEARAGYFATYFFLVRTELYNIFSAAGIDALHEMRTLGHRIGLHFDAALYPDDPTAQDDGARRELAALEILLGARVETVSFHRPARSLLNTESDIAGRAHTYQSRFFSAMGYCSDSRGAWHHGHPLDHAVLRERRALQLLTHPIWWYHDTPETPAQRTARFVHERTTELDHELTHHCVVHQPRAANGA